MPENFLNYLDDQVQDARAGLNEAFDDLGDDRLALVRSARLHTLLQVLTEARDYE